MKTVELNEAQQKLPALVRSKKTVTIARGGEAVAFLVSRERMEAIFESLEILSNPAAVKAIKRARSGKAKYIPLEDFERELDEQG